MGIFLQTAFAGSLIFLLYRIIIPGWRYHYSIVVVLLIIFLPELLLYSSEDLSIKRYSYFYEEPLVEGVKEKGVNPLEDKKEVTLNKDVEKIIAIYP